MVTAGGATNVKPFGTLATWPSGLVTTTVTAPALCAGVVSVIEVALTTITLVAATPPNVTVAPVVKSVPVSVTAVPPADGPEVGLTVVTVGGAMYVKPFARLPLWPSGLVTTTVTAPGACARAWSA